jgi:hypothetical protein
MCLPGYFDVALRDFGLALGAFALARLASEFDTRARVCPLRPSRFVHTRAIMRMTRADLHAAVPQS